MRMWRISIQIVGLISIALSFWGFAHLAADATWELLYPMQISGAPFVRPILVVNCLISVTFLTLMTFIAISLVRLKSNAVRRYTWLYIALVMYLSVPGGLWKGGPLARSIAAAAEADDFGISPLIFFPVPFVYAVLSVVLVNVAMKKLGGSADTLQPRNGPSPSGPASVHS